MARASTTSSSSTTISNAPATICGPLLWLAAAAGEITMSGYERFYKLLEETSLMPVFTEAPDSKFAFVVVAGKRARQLMSGASPLLANPKSHKSTRIAMEELNAGQLEYQTPDPDAEKDGKRRKE